MPTNEAKGILNDIGTEELAHLEMIGAIVYQLTRGVRRMCWNALDLVLTTQTMTMPSTHECFRHPFTAAYIQSKGDPSPTCMKTWPQNKKPVPLMKTL